jgi:hypothetical protein
MMLIVFMSAMVAGCGAYTQVQMNLVEQARKGVALSQSSAGEHEKVIARLHELERRRLDEAFDGDVRDQKTLWADWIIEHRKAYAIAIEAMAREKQDLLSAMESEKSNLQAVDAALAKLEWLESIQMQWTLRKELGNGAR